MRENGAPDDKEPARVRDPNSMDMGSDIVGYFDWNARIKRGAAGPFVIDRFPKSSLSSRAPVQVRT